MEPSMAAPARRAFEAALAEVGVKVGWDTRYRWKVSPSTPADLCWRASNVVAPLLHEPELSYDEWAAWMVENADPYVDGLGEWLDRSRPAPDQP